VSRSPRFKFVELSVVTAESIEETVNEWVAKGWLYDGAQFVVSDRSRRPQMAFLAFVRDDEESAEPDPQSPPPVTGGES
jgi:hypothetical protein